MIDDLVNQFADKGIIDKLNDPDQQEKIDELSDNDQKDLAQNIVISWLNKELEPKELLSLKREIPASKHDTELTGFERYLVQAVDLFAIFNGLCDKRNPHPEYIIQNELTPKVFDNLNDMSELKACLSECFLIPTIDIIVSKIRVQKERNELSKIFHKVFQSEVAGYVNGANEVKDLLDLLKGDKPWLMFEQRGINENLFFEHATLVESMISRKEAIEIGLRLQGMPEDKRGDVRETLDKLAEKFKGLDCSNESDNIFTLINTSLATIRPSAQEVKMMASKVMQNSIVFQSADTKNEKDESVSDKQMQI